ncbi:penicillin-binding protein 1B [Neiella sp. HB171785]|uniref:Penicillin-binding protein 1B n=1 Tax=Neiella litorisoli TaxID=2771431 RepID=A0A8J6QR94_9GAMM|nr:penicillin-binding protein 1B [Neiella litorisoli]MBD1389946.1 penicillin-binding protein 1B [Neiella litorisoli]
MSWRERIIGQDSWWRVIGKVAFSLAVLLAGYLIYLDSKLQQAFAELYQPHVLTVQARPLVIQSGIRLSATELVAELKALGYQQANQIKQLKQDLHSKLLVHHRDAIHFTATDHQQGVITVGFEQDRITKLQAAGSPLDKLTLAPVTLDKIWAGTREDRIWIDLQQVPEQLIELLLLVEDRGFYQHWGVNPIAIARAMVANLQAGHTVQGGSTLTQQLAKNLLLTRQRSLIRKLNEAFLALLMEWRYDKDVILEAYINEIYMGQHGATAIHGFATASQFYFNKPLHQLNLEQQVALVAMVKGPSLYNPWRRPEKLAERRDLILRMLLEREQLDTDLYQRISARPVAVVAKQKLQLKQRPAVVRAVRKELQQRISSRHAGELMAVATTIDPLSQAAMEQTAVSVIEELEDRHQLQQLQVAMIAVDSVSGAVRAMISDRRPDYPGYDRVTEAQRPIGSLLKPVILLAGLEFKSDMSLASKLNDRPVSMRSSEGKRWQPQNFDKQYRGSVVAIDALAKSLNVPFVNLGMSVGLEPIAKLLAGLTGAPAPHLYPSDLLGSVSMSPWQVAQLYSSLVNYGSYQPLYLVAGVSLDRSGNQHIRPPGSYQALDSSNAYQVMFAMQQVVKAGTAKQLQSAFGDAELAAKTGTSNDYRDAWFVGVDGREIVVVWVGRDDNQPIKLTGSQAAMQFYSRYLAKRKALPLQLIPPTDVALMAVDSDGQIFSGECQKQRVLPIDQRKDLAIQPCVKKETPKDDSVRPWWKRIFG